jgi:hypothetical protein
MAPFGPNWSDHSGRVAIATHPIWRSKGGAGDGLRTRRGPDLDSRSVFAKRAPTRTKGTIARPGRGQRWGQRPTGYPLSSQSLGQTFRSAMANTIPNTIRTTPNGAAVIFAPKTSMEPVTIPPRPSTAQTRPTMIRRAQSTSRIVTVSEIRGRLDRGIGVSDSSFTRGQLKPPPTV